ncbi:MAG: hypothetical protein IJN35_01025, partial [Muribaculaceae bacterium]|nr:hypothetical protein [Muribaculaceae bacterium]
VASRVSTLEHNNEELRNTNGCYLVTQFPSNTTNRFILSELSFLAKVKQNILDIKNKAIGGSLTTVAYTLRNKF